MIDQHFTPPMLADLLIKSLPANFHPKLIADFAVGEGSLLFAASKKWKKANFIANDLCSETLELLPDNEWDIYNFDFLDSYSLQASNINKYREKVDLILLNPPFSQRGVKPILWEIDNKIKSGVALAFLYNAVNFLKPGGFLVAVLPNGCLNSIRDQDALNFLKTNFSFHIISENCEGSFSKVRVKTSIVLIRNIRPKLSKVVPSNKLAYINELDVFRGKYQMHKIPINEIESGSPLVHTTNLKDGKVDLKGTHKVWSVYKVKGPAVIFPRVGNFNKGKICIFTGHEEIVISDCLFSVRCKSSCQAEDIKNFILNNWETFKENYSGTGALYSTLDKVQNFINSYSAVKAQEKNRKIVA